VCDEGRKVSECPTVIGFREGRLLVAQQPAMGISGMDNVDIAPLERTRRRRQKRRAPADRRMDMSVPSFVVAIARSSERESSCEKDEKRCGAHAGC